MAANLQRSGSLEYRVTEGPAGLPKKSVCFPQHTDVLVGAPGWAGPISVLRHPDGGVLTVGIGHGMEWSPVQHILGRTGVGTREGSMIDEFYRVLHERRDVRGEFTGEPISEEVLTRILEAAHSAPSVGLTQPWDFVLVRQESTRRAFAEHVRGERDVFAASLEQQRAETFANIKVEGIMESSLSVVVTYDQDRGAPDVLGRHAIADAGLYSVCLAIQNLWLAATAEQLGVGWVSFYREEFLRDLLGIPERIRPVAWLCLGPVTHLQDTPDLERKGWRRRRPLSAAVHSEHYDPARTAEEDHRS